MFRGLVYQAWGLQYVVSTLPNFFNLFFKCIYTIFLTYNMINLKCLQDRRDRPALRAEGGYPRRAGGQEHTHQGSGIVANEQLIALK